MNWWVSIDWGEVFVPTVPLPEILIRGTLAFLALCLLLRVVPKREAGGVSLNDLLFAAVLGALASKAMARRSESLTDFFLLALTVFGWNYALDWLAHRFPRLRKLMERSPRPLVKDGRILRHNLHREMLSEDDLMAKLRGEGIDDIGKVRLAHLEADGSLSVIKREQKQEANGRVRI